MYYNDEQMSTISAVTDSMLITPNDQIKYGASLLFQEVKKQTEDQLSIIHDADDLSTSEKITLTNQVQNRELFLMTSLLVVCFIFTIK